LSEYWKKGFIGCKNISGCCGAVRHRIAPAIDDMMRPVASGEKADTPHQSADTPYQSTAMNRKREGWLYVSKLHGFHSPLARHEIHKGADVAGEIAKGPVTKATYLPYKLCFCTKADLGVSSVKLFRAVFFH
jgi:hypothetical protein